MVEDEFYAVAQSFTQHLHYAEYVRRKKEAKAQSAAAIGDLERPTDGRTAMPKGLQRRRDAEELAARQKAGLEQVEGQEENTNGDGTDDDDDTWAGTHLRELITSPRKLRSLVGARELKSSTRAAAGFGQAPSVNNARSQLAAGSPPAALSRAIAVQVMEVDNDETASEDDDLDGQAHLAAMPSTAQPERDASPEILMKSDFRVQRRRQNDPKNTPRFEEANPSSTGISAIQTPKFKSRVQSLFDDLDELQEQPRPTNNSDKKREVSSAEDTTKISSEDNNLTPKSRFKDVPTFLV
ncbi:uncharacterized protein N7459_002886 [Penicillium hispanicum]|uniref:uncharacterized protein n=1 Tax=Penicillium hispanicum TaxID=1080232 RepID=UPI002541DFAA|nr:uncharacterized protein N7459_002886 [Penicillium hispanicum]KAJ5587121.1 hypothetical protein N7459_002886 [Penicillium hispanicum]